MRGTGLWHTDDGQDTWEGCRAHRDGQPKCVGASMGINWQDAACGWMAQATHGITHHNSEHSTFQVHKTYCIRLSMSTGT